MAKPVILAVDDEPGVLNAVERDLRRRFGSEYRIIKAGSGKEALGAVEALKTRNDSLALFVVDQRMPEMTGVEFLAQAIRFYPEARKVLLTAYADTEAAIQSINQIGLDHYLMKPWDPPDLNLYPVLEDLLSDWIASAEPPFEGIRVYGTQWSSECHNVKDFLTRNQIPYQWSDIETNPQSGELVERIAGGQVRLPLVAFPDGSTLHQPDYRTLAEKVGLQTQAKQPFYDLVIIGAGPAGLGAAVYGGSEGLRTIMIEKEATGGQAGTSSRIENYLGFPRGLSGADLARRAVTQARRFGVEILTAQEAVGVRVEDPYRYVQLADGSALSCYALLIASGVTTRRLDVPGVERLNGAGVYYGATLSEAAHYKGQDVYVIGGANSAGQGAMFFARYARKVTIVVRASLAKSMSQYLIDQIAATENIEVLTDTSVIEAHGEEKLEAVTLCENTSGATRTVPAGAMFLFIGAVPHTAMINHLVTCNPSGFIVTGPDLLEDGKRPKGWRPKRDPFLLETSVPGIFAAGDVRQGAMRRVASAVGEGAIAVSLIHQYLKAV